MQKGVREEAGLENRPIYLGEGEERGRGGERGGGEMSKQLRNKSLIWTVGSQKQMIIYLLILFSDIHILV
jgi:hypothetical protein